MNTDGINNLSSCIVQIPFKASVIENVKCLWFRSGRYESDKSQIYTASFFESLAAVVVPSPFFEDIKLTEETIVFEAEQYGGEGVGLNGGGVRCGNITDENLQIKGIGVSPVVGQHDNLYNSYGAYPLYEAITEATNHQIYDTILPVETVSYLAILGIGKSKYFVTAEEKSELQVGDTKLALGIREQVARLGHFIQSQDYKPHRDFVNVIVADCERVKISNKRLFKTLDGDISEVARIYLKNTANQFSFCYVNRIAHGALTPSNISIDGRLLDLTNTTFIPPGYTHITASGNLISKNEIEKSLEIFCLFAENFAMQVGATFNLSAFREFYYKQVNIYKPLHFLRVLGLDEKCFKHLSLQDINLILNKYNDLIENQKIPLRGVPRYQKTEGEIPDFILGLFSSLRTENNSNPELCATFKKIISGAYRSRTNRHESIKSFYTKIIIRCLRKLYFTPYFYVGRIYKYARELVNNDADLNISTYISHYKEMISWIYDKLDTDSDIFLYKNERMAIIYDITLDEFKIKETNHIARSFKISELRDEIENTPVSKYQNSDFSFLPGILDTIDLLESLYPSRI